MNTGKFIFAAMAAALLTACASHTYENARVVSNAGNFNPRQPQRTALAVTSQHDDAQKLTQYDGPNLIPAASSESIRIAPDQLFLRAWKFDESGKVGFQIYVISRYTDDLRAYDEAWDINGNPLALTRISEATGSCGRYGCTHVEHVGVDVNRDYLVKNQTAGIRFKLKGKGGEAIYFLPGEYVEGFLAAVK